MFNELWNIIRDNGKLTNQAQSCWGADRWEYTKDGVTAEATLEDDGYVRAIISEGLVVRSSHYKGIVFSKGDNEELKDVLDILLT